MAQDFRVGGRLEVVLTVAPAGTVIDVSPAILLLTPVFLPALSEAGVDVARRLQVAEAKP
mgnify:CR=1 FL=1